MSPAMLNALKNSKLFVFLVALIIVGYSTYFYIQENLISNEATVEVDSIHVGSSINGIIKKYMFLMEIL